MYLLLQFTFLSLLCLHAQGWVLQRSTPSNPWKSLELLENREMFLAALQSYFHSKGTHVDRTAPAFVLTLKDHDMGFRGTKEEQNLVNLEDGELGQESR